MAEIAERCRPFDEDLSALVDAELGAARRAEVEAHLAHCAACAARLAALRTVDAALASLPEPAVAPDLQARLARRLAAERGPGRGEAPSLRLWRARRVARILALPAAAAAALALYLALRAPAPPGGPLEPGAPLAKAPAAPPSPLEPAPSRELGKIETEPRPAGSAPAPAPATQVAEQAAPEAGEAELESLDTEDLGVVLDLDTIEDLPVIANLDLLERLLAAEAG